jgi:ABC-type amino acid transport substrate-binding protein
MYRNRIGLVIGVLLWTIAGVVCAQSTIEKIRSTNSITIAYRDSSIPFSYLDDDKRPIGYAIDLCLKIVAALRQETSSCPVCR